MRCRICDKSLTDAEIQIAPDKSGFEPCTVCMEIIRETAYCDGFVRYDALDELEQDEDPGDGAVELLDSDTFYSMVDNGDIGFSDPSH